ncbi:hypothetical protein [Streptomyces sp. NPDC054849]
MSRRKQHQSRPRPIRRSRRTGSPSMFDRVLGAFATGLVAVLVKEVANLLHRS